MAIETRRATPDDIPVLVEMMREFYAKSPYPLDRAWAAASFRALLQDDARGAAWIVFDESEAAGYVVLTLKFSMEHGGLDAFIDDLFVRTFHRGRGLARTLLDALFDECERRAVLAVHVEVGRDNAAAKALYNSYGLKPYTDGRETLTARLGERL